jgi:hypothetical protein
MKLFVVCFLLTSALLLSVTGCKKDDTSVNSGITNNAPTQPKNPTPSDSAINIFDSSDVVLSWESTDPDLNDTLKFDLLVGTSLPLSDVPIAANLVTPTYNLGTLTFPGTTFYWKVKAKDNHEAITEGNIWRFTIINRP